MNHRLYRLVTPIAFGMVLVALGIAIGALLVPNGTTHATDQAQVAILESSTLAERDRVFESIYNRVAPSVVSIVAAERSSGSMNQFFQASSGSGFVVDRQGHIVTNNHVVDGADRLEIRMFDGTITRAEIVGVDPDSDLAVLRVDVPAQRLQPLAIGDSDAVHVGQTVLALGNPFQNEWTLTSGIVSAIDRSIVGLNRYAIGGVIQTDAAINPGNSGGPLVNLSGELIGVNSQIESGVRQSSGIGFAVPSKLVERVVAEIIENGEVRYSYIGITSERITLDLIERYNLPDNIRGAAIGQAPAGLPASQGGVRGRSTQTIDIITAVDGDTIVSFDDLVAYLAINTRPGQTINVTVYRSGQVLNLPVTLTERPN